jgi:hypothetical protein
MKVRCENWIGELGALYQLDIVLRLNGADQTTIPRHAAPPEHPPQLLIAHKFTCRLGKRTT